MAPPCAGSGPAAVATRSFRNLPLVRPGDEQGRQGKIVHLDTPFTFEPIAWGIRKGDADFLNWLENFMFQVKNDGTYERLYHKWFQDDAWIKEIQ